jgi:hypothetical protein
VTHVFDKIQIMENGCINDVRIDRERCPGHWTRTLIR